ncbi:methyltransferase family protein [Flavisolibacter nicotianae]|uniref:methyltransferase family protein n=1 Tax=Flavisolibacter nicotianae TaxID=2364882 RepID=UPI0013C4A6A7|nr:isoprenylcysteine carboxylmethyltransferase family protein [Flavisolibacter nicotianae]
MLYHHILLAILWILYGVLHSVMANLGFKSAVRKRTGKYYRYYRLFYTVFAAVSLVALVVYQLGIPGKYLFQPTFTTRIIGGVLLLAGLVLMAVCIKKYFANLSGLKSLYQETPSSELMITGIHRYMRHPLYTGTFLAIWGLWVIVPASTLLIADVVITVYTLLAIQLEEEKLVAEFGDQYRVYQQTVPGLIPRF